VLVERLPGRVSKVANKYRPVDPTPGTTTRPWIVILGSLSVVAVGALWGAADLRAWVGAQEDLPAQTAWTTVAQGLDHAARVTGVAHARQVVDGWVAPLQHTAPVLARPAPQVPVAALGSAEPTDDTDAIDTDLPPGERWVGPDDPRFGKVQRVALIGASSIQYYLGVELERRLEAEFPGVSVHRLGKLGTGLVRQDVFDWPAAVDQILATHRPQVVVIQLGGNDAQPLRVNGERLSYGTQEWDAAYTERLQDLITRIQGTGATPVFLGMPVMRDAGFSGRMERMNTVTRAAAQTQGARYVPTWDLVSNADGTYRAQVVHEGRRGRMRLQDGIHYSRLGARFLADHLVTRLELQVPLVRQGTDGVHVRLPLPQGGPAHAWVPRQVPSSGLPVHVLQLPVEADLDWLDTAQRQIPAQAAERGVVVLALPASKALTHAVDEQGSLELTAQGRDWLSRSLPVDLPDAAVPVHRVSVQGLAELELPAAARAPVP